MLNNPMQMMMIQQMFGNHPKFNQIMGIIQGKSPQQLEQYVRNLAKNQDVDLNELAARHGFKI